MIVSEAMRAVATATIYIQIKEHNTTNTTIITNGNANDIHDIVSNTMNTHAACNAICKHIESTGGILHWAKYMPKDDKIQ